LDITQIRSDTVGCNSVIHLNNAGAALMPKTVANAIRDYITKEENKGGYEVADTETNELNLFYDYAAQLLNCKSSNIAYTTNATDSYNRALSSVPFRYGDVVLITDNDYPSNYIAFLSLQKRLGIKLIRVKNNTTGEIDLQDLENKLKQYSPRLVSITHVPTSSGLVQPVEEIGNVIRKHDTLYLLDACQSMGQMKVDAIATHADFISGTFRKFLRGPRGAGILYVSDKALDEGFEPLYIDLRGADWIAENEYRPQTDAKRFEDWESAYAIMMGSKEALKYLLSIGIENIEARNNELTSKLKKGLTNIDTIQLLDRGKKQCSIVTFNVQNKSEEATKKYFSEKSINIYTTPKMDAIIDFGEKGVEWVVRVSPHYYNSESEIDTFIEVTKEL
jgi:selenocysteine lyase/cysteine desulfurase